MPVHDLVWKLETLFLVRLTIRRLLCAGDGILVRELPLKTTQSRLQLARSLWSIGAVRTFAANSTTSHAAGSKHSTGQRERERT